MTPRAFLSLALLTILAVIGAIVVVAMEANRVGTSDRGGDPMFPLLVERGADVSQVTVEARRYSVTLERRNGGWVAIDRGDYPVKSEPVEQLITAMAQLTEFEPRTDNPELYPEIDVVGVGADTEDMHFMAQAADGTVLADAIVGMPSRSIGNRSGTFVRRTNGAEAWLVEGAVFFPNYLPEWFNPLLSVPGPDIGRVTIFSGDRMLFDASKISFETGDYELDFLDEAYQRPNIEAEDNAIRNLAQAVVSTTFDDARPRETVTVPDDARTIRFQTRNGLSLGITLVPIETNGVTQTWVLYDASAEPGSPAEADAAAMRLRTYDWAFLLPQSRIVTLSRDITQLVRVPVQQQAPTPLGPNAPAPLGPLIPGLR